MKSKNYPILLAALSVLFLFSACGNEPKTPESTEPAVTGGTPQIQGITKKISETPTNASLYATRGALWYENENFAPASGSALYSSNDIESPSAAVQPVGAAAFAFSVSP